MNYYHLERKIMMNKTLKKLLCIVMCFVMVAGSLTVTATAAKQDVAAVSASMPDGPNANGCFYLDGVMQRAYRLICFEDNWYYIAENHKYVKDATRSLSASLVEGTGIKAGKYYFDAEGKMVIPEPATEPPTEALNGPVGDYFYIDGVRQKAYQLLEYNGAWYFVAENHKIVKDTTRNLTEANLQGTIFTKPGVYYFDDQGRLFDRNGPQADGTFYINNLKQKAYKLCEYNGDYYYVAESNKICRNQTRNLTAAHLTGTPFQPGKFTFGADGKMVPRNGPQEDGYFYLDNVKQTAYKLIRYEGNYYYICEYHKYAKDAYRYLSADLLKGTGFSPAYYNFDSQGRLVTKNGPCEDGYFYINNVKQKAYSLKEYEGKYYYICEYNKFSVSQTRNLSATAVAGTPFPAGKYDFDETGAMVIKNGPQDDGYFYLDGIRQRAFQLIYYEGYYYFVSNNHQYIKSRTAPVGENVVEGMTYEDGTPIKAGYYTFDADGRMVINFVSFEGIDNVRDIGGYSTTNGKTVKKGLLLRGPELDGAVLENSCITELDKNKLVNTYGIKTEMDLRDPAVSLGDMLGSTVTHKYYNAPQYEDIFTEDGKAKMKAIFTDLADPDNYPVYLHCTYGIDRTGTTCYILEAVLGMTEAELQTEYALSNWYRSFNQKKVNKIKTGLASYSGANINERAVNYLLSCGITQEQIASLRNIFLTD